MPRENDENLIVLSNVSKLHGTKMVLKDINLALTSNTITTIIGPNGAGKTTLLRIMLGLDKPSQGQVKRAPNLTLGYVPQKFHKDPMMPLSVQGFLKLTKNKPSLSKIEKVLDELQVSHLKQIEINKLSGGELQRILLARALLRDPKILALDEPLQGVDLKGQIELYRLIADINKRYDCSVVMVSHDLHFVMAQTDQVVCLNQHICCSGQAQSVRNHPEYQKLFGLPNLEGLAIYSHYHDHTHHLDGSIVSGSHTENHHCESSEGTDKC